MSASGQQPAARPTLRRAAGRGTGLSAEPAPRCAALEPRARLRSSSRSRKHARKPRDGKRRRARRGGVLADLRGAEDGVRVVVEAAPLHHDATDACGRPGSHPTLSGSAT